MSKPTTRVVIAEDAIEQLAARLKGPALVVADANTEEAAGRRVLATVRASQPDSELLVFAQRSGLVASPEAIERVRGRLWGTRVPVAVGAGVITDIVRRAADLDDRDFLSVPTAASMDGYASSVAALQLGGVKVTVPARAPLAIFADPRVPASAARELTRAGLGDLLAKATARVDWLAGHLLYGERFLVEVDQRMVRLIRSVAADVERVLGGQADAIAGLLRGLIESGEAIVTVGSSRPASGCEHHASHFWDLLADRGLRSPHLHGLQVGYATWFAMRLQRFAFGGAVAQLRPPHVPSDPLGPGARRWLGEPSSDVVEAVAEKQRCVGELSHWPGDDREWAVVRERIAPALGLFDEVEAALRHVGIPADPGYLDVDRPTLRATFRYASRLRARYTVIDFLEGQGVLDDAIEATIMDRVAEQDPNGQRQRA